MTSFATELATPSVTDVRTYAQTPIPRLIYKNEHDRAKCCAIDRTAAELRRFNSSHNGGLRHLRFLNVRNFDGRSRSEVNMRHRRAKFCRERSSCFRDRPYMGIFRCSR